MSDPSRGSEDELVDWLRGRLHAERDEGGEGDADLLGDDAACLPASPVSVPRVLTVDSQIEGVHFPEGLDPALLAQRLLAVNLSDLAAMGAVPRHALLALCGRFGFDHRRFFDAFLEACRTHGVTLAGGDLARSPGGTVATLTLEGELPGEGKARFLRRRDARPGDALWVGGTLGESAAGQRLIARGTEALTRAGRRAVQRHLLPRPQLALGRALGRLPRVAAMDLSDGLARDLPRLCRESRVGAEVEADLLPWPPGFEALCERLEESPTELALGGGEDYVLLFTLPPETEPPETPEPCHRIGTVTEDRVLRLRRRGRWEPWPDLGWDHLAEEDPRGAPGGDPPGDG